MKKFFSALAICFCAGAIAAFSACQPTIKDPAALYESFLNQQSEEKNFSSGDTLDGMSTVVYRNVTTSEEFFNAIEAKQSVKLLNDLTLSPLEGNENKASIVTLTHEHHIYVHLNGFDLTAEKLPDNSGRYYSFLNEGTLTLLGDGSTILSRGIKNNGILTIAGDVTVETNDTKGAAIVNNGALHLKGGTLKTTKNGALCLNNYGDAHLLSGTLDCASAEDYAVTSSGNMEINGADITAVKGGVCVTAGDAFIESGNVTATEGYALTVTAGRVTVYGGSLVGKEKAVLLSSAMAKLTLSGGTLDVLDVINDGGEVIDNRNSEE